MDEGTPISDVERWCRELAEGTTRQKPRAWEALIPRGGLWAGCQQLAAAPAGYQRLRALYELLRGGWDRTPLLQQAAVGPDTLAAQTESVARLLAAAVVAAAARGDADEQESVVWALRAAGRPAELPSPTGAVLPGRPEQRIRRWFAAAAEQWPAGLTALGTAQDAALALACPEDGGPPPSICFREARVPVLLARGEEGYVAWLLLEQLDDGFGEFFPAAESLFDPLRPDLRGSLEEAWQYVLRRQARPEGGVRWRLLDLPVDRPGAPLPVQGTSLQAAAAVGLTLLLTGRPYDPTCVISAALGADGGLQPVGGILEAGEPKVRAAASLKPENGLATLVVASATRLSGARRVVWDRAGVRVVPASTVEAAVGFCSSPAAARDNLPCVVSRFIGREREIETVHRMLNGERLVTLTGPGGIGKTRLSLGVGRGLLQRYHDGAWFVELAPLSDASLVAQAAASALGVKAAPGQSAEEAVIQHLRGRELLLILDNCEHLVDACALFAEGLLARCPRVSLLCSSREALRIAGEATFPVPPLPVPEAASAEELDDSRVASLGRCEALALFVQRASLVRHGFELTRQNAPALVRLTRALEGIPLAIELAAARAGSLSPEELCERLADRFQVLTGGLRTATPRQQTLRGAIDWSFDLLSPEQRDLFCRIAVFTGPWTAKAAEEISDFGFRISDCSGPAFPKSEIGVPTKVGHPKSEIPLSSLVAKSLLIAEQREGATVYRLLETLRAYGLERLEEQGVLAEFQQRHALYYVSLARREGAHLEGEGGGGAEAALRRIDFSLDNYRAALAWALANDGAAALELVRGLGLYWLNRGYWTEAREAHRRAIEVGQDGPPALRARVLRRAGVFAYNQGDAAGSERDTAEALALYTELDDPFGIATARFTLGQIARLHGDLAGARAHYETALDHFAAIDRRGGLADVREALGALALHEGDLPGARAHLERCLELNAALQRSNEVARGEEQLGTLAQLEGDYETALAHFARGERFLRRDGDQGSRADLYSSWGVAELERGDREAADRLLNRCAQIARLVGSKSLQASATAHLARLDLARGDLATAGARLEESLEDFRGLEHQPGMTNTLHLLARVALSQADPARARRCLAESLALRLATGHRVALPASLESAAAVLQASGQAALAARLAGAAAALRMTLGTPLPPCDWEALAQTLADLRRALGDAGFDAAFQLGAETTAEAAAQEALAALRATASCPVRPRRAGPTPEPAGRP